MDAILYTNTENFKWYPNDKIFTNFCLFKNVSSFKGNVTITGIFEF